MHTCVHCIIYNSQDMEITQVSIIRQEDKEAVEHIYNGISLSHKNKIEILPFVTAWMDLEGIMPSEISQSEKDKYQ